MIYIEEIQDDLKKEKNIYTEDFELIFKHKYAYLRFFFDNYMPSPVYKLNKKKVKNFLIGRTGTVKEIMCSPLPLFLAATK